MAWRFPIRRLRRSVDAFGKHRYHAPLPCRAISLCGITRSSPSCTDLPSTFAGVIQSRKLCVKMDAPEISRVTGCNRGINDDRRGRNEQVLTQFNASPRRWRGHETLEFGDCGKFRVLSRNGYISLNDSRFCTKQAVQPTLLVRGTRRVFSTQQFDAALYLEHRTHRDTELLRVQVGKPIQNGRTSPSPAEVRQNVGIEQKDFRQ